MKKKLITGLMITSIVATGVIPVHTFATPMAQAEIQEENMTLSSSLRKLGAQSKLIQMYIDQSLMNPNVQLDEVPALNTEQFLIKQDMKEWAKVKDSPQNLIAIIQH